MWSLCYINIAIADIYVIGKSQHKFASHTKHNIGIGDEKGLQVYMTTTAKSEKAGG